MVCPGDLGDKADRGGITDAWKFINSVATQCGAKAVIAATGNHEVDSRLQSSLFNPLETLKALSPVYPINQLVKTQSFDARSAKAFYWSDNFCIYSEDHVRLITLNTCAFHGYSKDDRERELDFGRIDNNTISAIQDTIKEDDQKRVTNNSKPSKFNILVCHHPLRKSGNAQDEDNSQMVGAHALIEMLGKSEYGRWLVIHGHRHRGEIYHAGSGTGPWVLSAASFGSTKERDYANTSPNQAHLVSLDDPTESNLDFAVIGDVVTWTWFPHADGWKKDIIKGPMPPSTGFGWIGSTDRIAADVMKVIGSKDRVTQADLVCELPVLMYITHSELIELKKTLHKNFEVSVSLDALGRILEIGRTQ